MISTTVTTSTVHVSPDTAKSITSFFTNSPGNGKVIVAAVIILVVLLIVLQIMAKWRVFTKAGKPGWASLVPVLAEKTMFEIAGVPWKGFYLFTGLTQNLMILSVI